MGKTLAYENKKYSKNFDYKGLAIRVESLTDETNCLISTIIFYLKDGRTKNEDNIGQVEKVFYNRLKPLENEFLKELKLFNEFIVITTIPEVLSSKKENGSYCEVELYLKSDNIFQFNRKIAEAVPQYQEAKMATEYFCEHILECIDEVEILHDVKFNSRKIKKSLL